MPNTLAHIGVHGLITRAIIRNADLKWIYAGCVIPDVPWILQRIIRAADIAGAYETRLWAIAAASLFGCLWLCLALAVLTRQWARTLGILTSGALLHLLLDACQIKWANGVHLFVPVDWRLVQFGWFWPEDLPTDFLTLFGLAYAAVMWRKATDQTPLDRWPGQRRLVLSVCFMSCYLMFPLLFSGEAEKANNHYVQTLRQTEGRAGKPVEIDRALFLPTPSGGEIRLFTGEKIAVSGCDLDREATVSVRGRFVTPYRIAVSAIHIHRRGLRDLGSYLGLGLIIFVWTASFLNEKMKKPTRNTRRS